MRENKEFRGMYYAFQSRFTIGKEYIYIYSNIFFERVQGRENLTNVAANIDRIIVEFPFIPLPLSSLSNHLSIHLETSRATAERYTQQWRTEMRKRGNPLSLLV